MRMLRVNAACLKVLCKWRDAGPGHCGHNVYVTHSWMQGNAPEVKVQLQAHPIYSTRDYHADPTPIEIAAHVAEMVGRQAAAAEARNV